MFDSYTDRDVLTMFVESVDELLDSEFLQQVQGVGISCKLEWSNNVFLFNRKGPKRDSIKAVLLTLRFFGQNSEPTSLCNMEERINCLEIDPASKERFRTLRHDINVLLDKAPLIKFPKDAGVNSNRRIYDIILYGIFAHANPEKRKIVKEWEKQPFIQDILCQFDLICLEYINILGDMSRVCSEYLKIMK
jgi:hypothetical protein